MPTDPPEPRAPHPEHGADFIFRGPKGLKGRAVRASRKRNMKLSPWLVEAIEEKCQREETGSGEQEWQGVNRLPLA